jgi:tRNA pseudouridine55 synthase
MDGFLNLHKPLTFTSHDCVARLRRLLKTKKIGHAGTLDPMADGVLPMAIGRATRLLQFLPQSKAYRAIVRFGVTTTTDDLEGEILTQMACPEVTLEQIKALLPQFIGTIDQIPPAFSAIQIEGKRLYDLARAGIAVDVPMRTVEVSEIKVLAWRGGEFPEIDLDITCGGGTYIRAIARDLGAALGTGATLAGLTRTHSSGFDLTQSLTFEAIEMAIENQSLVLTAVEQPLMHHPSILLNDEETWRWCNGQKIAPPDKELPIGQVCRAKRFNPRTQQEDFLGIAEVEAREDFVFLRAKMAYAECPCDRPSEDPLSSEPDHDSP